MDCQSFFNKNDYAILDVLIANECYSAFKSLTTGYIIEDTGLSHVKVRQTLKNFIMLELVKEGTKDGNSKTYFVTEKGKKHYMDVFNYNDKDIADLVKDEKDGYNKK